MSVTTIPNLSVLSYDARHMFAHKALIHQSDEVQVNVYVVEPGGRIPPHKHTGSWDISFVIAGEIEARYTENGQMHTVRCGSQAVHLVPPGVVHEVVNPSTRHPARFLLIQSPSRNFDFIQAGPPQVD